MTQGGRRPSAFEPVLHDQGDRPGHRPRPRQVYGFVKQSGGHVKIYSEVGLGTTVKLYLPRLLSERQAASPCRKRAAPAPRSASAETDPRRRGRRRRARPIRPASCASWATRVLEARLPRPALQLLERHPEIKLLFTDVGLPGGMNGRQLADAARSGPARPQGAVHHRLCPQCHRASTAGSIPASCSSPSRSPMPPSPPSSPTSSTSRRAPPRILLVEDEVLVPHGRHRPARGSRLSRRHRRVGDGSDEQGQADGRRHRPGDRRYRPARHQGRRAGGRAARSPSRICPSSWRAATTTRRCSNASPTTRASASSASLTRRMISGGPCRRCTSAEECSSARH